MKNFKLKFRGETLAEVLVAIGILGVVLVTSLLLVNRGIGTNVSVKNKIIAINIAREGIEGVRNIRDTNWLKYSGDRRNKWLYKQYQIEGGGTGSVGNGVNESFALDFDGSEFTLFDPDEQNKLDLSDPSGDWSKYRLYKDSNKRYTHDNNSGTNPATIFYRQIILKTEQPPECSSYTSPNNCSNSRLHVISRVQWREPLLAGNDAASQSDLIGTIEMETYLYDYLGRDEY